MGFHSSEYVKLYHLRMYEVGDSFKIWHINTSEIKNEVSRENDIFTRKDDLLSSHVERSQLLWLHIIL